MRAHCISHKRGAEAVYEVQDGSMEVRETEAIVACKYKIHRLALEESRIGTVIHQGGALTFA